MENFSYHVPFYVVNNGVATSGHSADLATAQVGIFDRANFSVATGGGTGKELFFAQGTLGGKDWYTNKITATSHKSPFFRVSDVEDIYVALPQTIQDEEWIIGYNGSPTSKTLRFAKDEATRLQLYFFGEATYRFFGGPKTYLISHTPIGDCETPCETGDCVDRQIADPIKEAKVMVDQINNHVELRKFGVKASLVWDGYVDEGTGGTNTATIKYKITLPRKADGSDRTADIQAILAGVDGIVKSSNVVTVTKTAGTGATTEGIADDYVVTLTSYEEPDVKGGLSSNVTFRYAELISIDGNSWTVVTDSETDPATVDSLTPVAGRKVGIRISASYTDPKFGNDSFDLADYYQNQPIKMEVSMLDEDASRCDVALWPSVLQTKVSRIARQTGEYVVREVISKTDAYLKHMRQYDASPRMREAFDMQLLNSVDRKAFYKLYYVRFKASYGDFTFRGNEQEKFTAVFALKDGTINPTTGAYEVASADATAQTNFETNIIDVLETKTGITMHTNS